MKRALNTIAKVPLDLKINLVLLALGALLLRLVSGYPEMARRFPQLVLIAMVVFVALDILRKTRMRMRQKGLQAERTEGTEEGGARGRALGVVGLMLAFFVVMRVFGFTLGTFLFLFFSSWALGYRQFKVLLFSACVITGFIYIMFISIMDSYFPPGLLFGILGG